MKLRSRYLLRIAVVGHAAAQHTATLLTNGKVLSVGGYQLSPPGRTLILSTAELYDPSTGTFSTIPGMIFSRWGHTATLLPDGKLPIAGGSTPDFASLPSAEIYDPSSGTFAPTGDMTGARRWHTATLVSNGKGLITGGYPGPLDTSELYDPATGAFRETGKRLER